CCARTANGEEAGAAAISATNARRFIGSPHFNGGTKRTRSRGIIYHPTSAWADVAGTQRTTTEVFRRSSFNIVRVLLASSKLCADCGLGAIYGSIPAIHDRYLSRTNGVVLAHLPTAGC